jgi:hypothetical protein
MEIHLHASAPVKPALSHGQFLVKARLFMVQNKGNLFSPTGLRKRENIGFLCISVTIKLAAPLAQISKLNKKPTSHRHGSLNNTRRENPACIHNNPCIGIPLRTTDKEKIKN